MTKYHWIMTLQAADNGRIAASTTQGSADLAAGTSRGAAYAGVVSEARRMSGLGEGPVVVLFFSLEPDEL